MDFCEKNSKCLAFSMNLYGIKLFSITYCISILSDDGASKTITPLSSNIEYAFSNWPKGLVTCSRTPQKEIQSYLSVGV